MPAPSAIGAVWVKESDLCPCFRRGRNCLLPKRLIHYKKNMSHVCSSREGLDDLFVKTCFCLKSEMSLNSLNGEIKRKGSPFVRLAFY